MHTARYPRQTVTTVNPIFLVAFALACCIVLALCELTVVTYRPRLARHVGYSVASFSGELAEPQAGVPSDLAGLEVHRLDCNTYLAEPHHAWNGGSREDANLAGLSYAIIAIEDRRFTMDVRTNVGYALASVAAVGMAIMIGTTPPRPMLGRLTALLFAAAVLFATVTWPRRVRARFARAAQQLRADADQPERATAPLRSR
jgi:hypothetical protein